MLEFHDNLLYFVYFDLSKNKLIKYLYIRKVIQ